MKKKSFFVLVLLFVISSSCKNPIDDFNVHINPAFYDYVVDIELSEIGGDEIISTEPFTITISGEDAQYVYASNGTKNYSVQNNSIQLILEKNAVPQPNDPINFAISLESNVYKSKNLNISIFEEDYYYTDFIELLNTSKPIIGTNVASTSLDLSTGFLTSPQTFNAQSDDGSSQISLDIGTNVGFLNSEGIGLSGNLDITILSFSDTSSISQEALEALTPSTIHLDGTTDDLEQESTPTFEINMTVGGEKVTNFQNAGISTRISLPNDMINPNTLVPFSSGDSLGLISYTEGESDWKFENDLEVKSDANGLFVEPEISHLSFFKLVKNFKKRFKKLKTFEITFAFKIDTGKGGVTERGTFFLRGYKTIDGVKVGKERTWKGGRFRANDQEWKESKIVLRKKETDDRNLSFVVTELKLIIRGSGHPFTFQGSSRRYVTGRKRRIMFFISIPPPNKLPLYIGYVIKCGSNLVKPPAGVKLYKRLSGSGDRWGNPFLVITSKNRSLRQIASHAFEEGLSYDIRAVFADVDHIEPNIIAVNNKIYEVLVPPETCASLGL
tara:strand:+ start:29354 stop:31021 length:1668 start_codon:yes stop_codon:yes gene_type:complete